MQPARYACLIGPNISSFRANLHAVHGAASAGASMTAEPIDDDDADGEV